MVIFSLVIADLAITSPTPFLDPVWNNAFGFFWFIAFLGLAFVIGLGNLQYFPLLLFIGSVAVDSNLQYLPSVAVLLVATFVCGWLTRKPPSHRWLWWTGGVAVICWAGPFYQQFFEARPNLSLLLRSSGILAGGTVSRTEGWAFGLRAVSRAASLNPIWASPRPIDPFAAANDIAHRNILLGLVLAVLVGVAVAARKHRQSALFSMCVVSIGAALGLVFLYAHTPTSDLFSFIWISLALWPVGICIWLTLGLAVAVAIAPQVAAVMPQIASLRAESGRRAIHVSASTKRSLAVFSLGLACIAGILVLVFPYGDQFVFNWTGVTRVQHMSANIEDHVPKGPVGMGVLYSGPNLLQSIGDEHGAAYLLLTRGWTPGMEPQIDQLLGMPIDKDGPFAVFTERGEALVSAQFYPKYQPLWFLKKPQASGT